MSKQTLSELINALEDAIEDFEEGENVRFAKDLRWKEVEKIFDILDKITEKEKGRDNVYKEPDFTSDSSCEHRGSRFLGWLQFKHHVETQIITMKVNRERTKYELWLLPNRTITSDEILFCLPPKVFMSSKDAAKKLKFLGMDESDLNSTLLTMFLIYEKYVVGEKSYWKPYIDVLPSIKYYNDPICFSREDLASTRDCRNLYCLVLNSLFVVMSGYCVLWKRLSKEKNLIGKGLAKVFTFKKYLWARAVMSLSYLGTAVIDPKSGEVLENKTRLIPLIEMCDIKEMAEPYVSYISDTDGNHSCHAIGFPEVPCQLTRTYHDNSAYYFETYGYIPSEPVCIDKETYKLNLSIPRVHASFSRREKILSYVKLTTQETFELKPGYFLNRILKPDDARVVCRKLFIFVHVFQAKDELLERIEEGNFKVLEVLTTPSKEAWNFLSERFKILSLLCKRFIQNSNEDYFKQNRNPELVTSRERLIHQYVLNEWKCLDRLSQVAADRRDNDPNDVEGQAEEEVDEDVIQLSDKTKALFSGVQFSNVSPGNCSYKEVYGPISCRPLNQ